MCCAMHPLIVCDDFQSMLIFQHADTTSLCRFASQYTATSGWGAYDKLACEACSLVPQLFHAALQVTRQLRMDGWPALSIHGDKSQQERDWVLAEFKQNKSPIMLATDVAARGLGRTKFDCMHCHCSLQSEDHMLVQMCTSFALCL